MKMDLDHDTLKEFMLEEVRIVQSIIKRMASNSFLIKGWTVTLIVATLLLKGEATQVFIAYLPLVVFWILDAYFLRQERMYRKLYEWIVENRLQTDEHLFDMNAHRFQDQVPSVCDVMFTITLGLFYGSLLLLLSIYTVALLVN